MGKKLRLNSQGFSLIEVLVALSVSSLLYLGAYSVLSTALNTNDLVAAKAEKLKRIQRSFHFIQKDMEQIVPRAVKGSYGEDEPALNSASDSGLEFTRLGWRNPVNRPRSDMQRVAYRLEDRKLIRRHWLVLDRPDSSEPKDIEIYEGVESFEYRFYDQVEGTWVDSWPKSGEKVVDLPSAIELSMETDDFGEIKRIFRVVPNAIKTQ